MKGKDFKEHLSQRQLKEFAQFVASMRKSTGLDLTNFAKKMGVHSDTIKEYETGISVPEDLPAFMYDVREVVKTIHARKRRLRELATPRPSSKWVLHWPIPKKEKEGKTSA